MYLKKGITEQLQSSSESGNTVSMGFNPEENKWYGWSHRAIYGFTIRSKCEIGNCHYRAANKEDYAKKCKNFWDSDDHLDITTYEGECDGLSGVWVKWTYNDKVKNKKIRGTTGDVFNEYPDKWGKGKWVAKTIDDAKQMAIDFAAGVA